MKLSINTDGASRGNPGLAAASFLIKSYDGVILHQEGKVIGLATNNIAEYTAVKFALLYIKESYAKKLPHLIDLYTDSKLVAEQLSGNYKIKNSELLKRVTEIKKLEPELGEIRYHYIPRAENFIADKLCNIALDNHQ